MLGPLVQENLRANHIQILCHLSYPPRAEQQGRWPEVNTVRCDLKILSADLMRVSRDGVSTRQQVANNAGVEAWHEDPGSLD